MSHRMGTVGAGCLLVLAGCLNGVTMEWGPQEAVDTPLGEVAAVLQAGLEEEGIHVTPKRRPSEVLLAGQTKSGNVFCIFVKRQKAKDGRNTVVTIRWDHDDKELWRLVSGLLTAPPAEEKPSGTEAGQGS